jgi:hypothetical protein
MMKIKDSDIEELMSMASLYNHWSLESCRMALMEIKRKLNELRTNDG